MVALPSQSSADLTMQPASRANVRSLGINPDYWYVVARSDEVTDQPHGVVLWEEAIVLYRDANGHIQA